MKEHISVLRVIPLLIIAGATIVLSSVLGLMKDLYWDEALCLAFVDMLFLMIFIYELEYDRKHRLIANNIATTFSKVAIGYVVCCIIAVAFLVCPNFFMPVMLFPIIMVALGNEFLGISVGIYLVVIYGTIFEVSSFEIICYIMMVLLAGGLAKTLNEKKYRLQISFLLLCINLIIPLVFQFLSVQKMEWINYVFALASGIISAFTAYFIFFKLRKNTDEELENIYWDIIVDDYSEVKKLEKYFPADYEHAKRVSQIAIHVANHIGLSAGLCGAAGFYYRIGKWSGGDYLEAGVEKAQLLNFPIELIRIISEYNGEQHKPSTPESAIIHMIDALTVKLDALNEDVAKSTWNHEMIIYQTLNEFSSAGLYDESGLSMNQFLKVREFLVKEKSLQ